MILVIKRYLKVTALHVCIDEKGISHNVDLFADKDGYYANELKNVDIELMVEYMQSLVGLTIETEVLLPVEEVAIAAVPIKPEPVKQKDK